MKCLNPICVNLLPDDDPRRYCCNRCRLVRWALARGGEILLRIDPAQWQGILESAAEGSSKIGHGHCRPPSLAAVERRTTKAQKRREAITESYVTKRLRKKLRDHGLPADLVTPEMLTDEWQMLRVKRFINKVKRRMKENGEGFER